MDSSQLPNFWVIFAPLALILACISVLIGIITITMTVLYNKAQDLDRQDKLEYISSIWVGSRSGFLRTMFLLWCPLLTAFVFYKPLVKLSPYYSDIAAAMNSLLRQAR